MIKANSKKIDKSLRVAALGVVLGISSVALAADTNYDMIREIKAFSTGSYVNLLMEDETNTCGGSSNSNFNIPDTEPELVRLAEAAWFAGKEVRLEYTCTSSFPVSGTTSAKVTGVRAR